MAMSCFPLTSGHISPEGVHQRAQQPSSGNFGLLESSSIAQPSESDSEASRFLASDSEDAARLEHVN